MLDISPVLLESLQCRYLCLRVLKPFDFVSIQVLPGWNPGSTFVLSGKLELNSVCQ
jgi:hypothetical protein